MESRIRVLSDHTINKIAAGEVIENPASVVKELVENSLDAGAKDICIEIIGGGRQLIRITDDGCGMNPDDALLCLERHATSKIRAVEEINDIVTMGFRGEAIPSIAAISKFTLLTNPNNSSFGTMVIVDGGKIVGCNPVACAKGTSIEIKNLFFNVPVRKKFLKSPAVDANDVLKTVSMMALGYPEIRFQLIIDGKPQISMPIVSESSFGQQIQMRIGEVIGKDFLENVVYFKDVHNEISVEGVVGNPSYTRHNRSGQFLFINRRAVVSPLVIYAVKDGYGTALATGRHPVFVLHLTIPGSMVDVNVHPQKREVRLRQEQLIREIISKAVTKTLNKDFHCQQTPISVFSGFEEERSTGNVPFHKSNHDWIFQPNENLKLEEKAWDQKNPDKQSWNESQSYQPIVRSVEREQVLLNPLKSSTGQAVMGQDTHVPVSFFDSLHSSAAKMRLKVLGTINRSILVDGSRMEKLFPNDTKSTGLVLIDQRAAHMRILYEQLSLKEQGTQLAQQVLLIPYSIEVPAFDADALRKAIPSLTQMGISMKEFGPRSFVVEAIPQIFGNSNLETLVDDIIRDVRASQNGQENEFLFQRERVKRLAIAAGRSAVHHDHRLTIEEAQSLLDQLCQCEQPFQCPLGKSIIVRLTADDLAKLFQK